MKVPIKTGIYHGSSRPTQVRQKQNSTEVGQSIHKDPGSFNKLLKKRVESIRAKADFINAALPLDREELRQLVEIIQMQMNDYLFRALAESDEDNTLYGFQLDWMNFRGIGNQVESFVSKIQHAPKKTQGVQSRADIDHIIDHASKAYGVDPDLTKAVIRAESDFDANLTSPKGAMGLMQLMPETAKELGVKNSYNPSENIMAGTRYLKSLLHRYDGNIPLALAAYNWGMGNVERHPDRLPSETRTYIARVNKYYREVKSNLVRFAHNWNVGIME